MTKFIQILVIAALVAPLATLAREETLEERKKRITRKYIKKDTVLSESDLLVPSTEIEDERVLDSEKFKGKESMLNQQSTTSMPMPRPPARRPTPQKENRNWLLEEADAMSDDPYAMDSSQGDSWNSWGEEERTPKKRKKQRQYTPTETSSSRWGSTSTADRWGKERNSGFSKSGTQTDLFGRQRQSSTLDSSRSSTFSPTPTPRTYGSSPDSGLLNSPFSSKRTMSPSGTPFGSDKKQGHQPYKSSFQTSREQGQKSWGTQSPKTDQQFKRADPYQSWKKKNQAWDPSADDAYLNEIMHK